MEKKFSVSGMTCSACSAHVEKSVRRLEGVRQVSVSLLTNSMSVDYDEKCLNEQAICDTVAAGGYGASPVGKPTPVPQPETGNSGQGAGAEGGAAGQNSAADGKKPVKLALKMKLIKTKDGKIWEVAFSSDKMYRLSVESGKASKDPAIAMPIRQALEQFVPEAPGVNKAPDIVNGIVINPTVDPLFIGRDIIAQILKLEEMARKSPKNK